MKARWSRQAVWSAGLLLLGMAFLAGSAQGAYAISPLQLLRILQDMVAGPDHRIVLPGSALLGAALVLAADAVARTAVKPAELPLGVLTAFIGVPMFLFMLRHFRGRV